MRKVAASLAVSLVFVLFGCSTGTIPNSLNTPVAPAVKGLQGVVHGGQQAVTGATITLWAVGTMGDGSAATLLTSTTPVGGNFTLGSYTCPAADPDVYITASGGNPGLTAGTNNTAILMMAALTDCNTLKANAATTFVWIDEVTTVGAVAALYPYLTSTSNLSYGAGDAAAFATAFSNVSEYTNTTTGTSPGPSLPGGYYASSTEINTLGNIIGSCINSTGGVAGDGSACGNLFNLTKSSGVAPTTTLGAMLNILNNPTQNVSALFNLPQAIVQFQPVDNVAPSSWALPILQDAATPTFSVAGGTYGSAQFVTLSDTTSGAVIHYTVDGSTPTSASPIFSGTAITVSSSETINAIAQAGGFGTSAVGTASYTITGSTTTYMVGGFISPSNGCGGVSVPPTTVTLSQGSTIIGTTTTSSGAYSFSGVPNGTYTVTPSITGPSAVFYPSSQSVVVNGGTGTATFGALLGYTVSGTVAYNGSQTGQIYLVLNPTQCGSGGAVGTSISATGAYIIHGVPPGNYTLNAFMDDLGKGTTNASNPSGSLSVSVSNANYSGANVTLVDPATVTVTNAPTITGVGGFNNGAIGQYKPVVNGNGVEEPTSYTLQWSTSPTFSSPPGVAGSKTFPANGTRTDVWLLSSGTSPTMTTGSTYYFQAYGSSAGTATGPLSNIFGPVSIGPPAPVGGVSVSGAVSFSGSATGPLYAGFYNPSNSFFYGEYLPNPVSAQAYSVQVPPNASYVQIGVLDQNNDGIIDAGDIQNTDSQSLVFIGGTTANQNLTLPSGNSAAVVTTQNYQSIVSGVTSQYYALSFKVTGQIKLPVAVQLTSGPNVISPIDIAVCGGPGSSCDHGFQIYFPLYSTSPNIGDSYNFNVKYSDGTSGTVTATVTGVLNNFVTNLSPQTGTNTMPTFSWSYPANPGNYTYQFSLGYLTGGDIWDIPSQNSNANGFASSQIPTGQIPWDTDPTGGGSTPSVGSLTPGTTYVWSIELQDSNGNATETQVQYTP